MSARQLGGFESGSLPHVHSPAREHVGDRAGERFSAAEVLPPLRHAPAHLGGDHDVSLALLSSPRGALQHRSFVPDCPEQRWIKRHCVLSGKLLVRHDPPVKLNSELTLLFRLPENSWEVDAQRMHSHATGLLPVLRLPGEMHADALPARGEHRAAHLC